MILKDLQLKKKEPVNPCLCVTCGHKILPQDKIFTEEDEVWIFCSDSCKDRLLAEVSQW
jgi:hypothetical protein